jgi:hypothetical protein
MKSLVKSRVTLTELAGAAGLTENAVRYRVRRGQMTPPNRHGLFERARALREMERKPKQRGGRRSGSARVASRSTSDAARDATDRYRRAKAQQEELKLALMRGDVIDARTMERRVAAFFRLVRDRIIGFVSRSAATIAAHTAVTDGRVDEESLARAMMIEVGKLLRELRSFDPREALRTDSDSFESEEN